MCNWLQKLFGCKCKCGEEDKNCECNECDKCCEHGEENKDKEVAAPTNSMPSQPSDQPFNQSANASSAPSSEQSGNSGNPQ
ncbi:MAG: hypothetical protein WC545_00890 [Patescibacteria group bacterium]